MANGNRKSSSRVHAPVSAFIGSVKIPLNLRYSLRSRYKDSRGTGTRGKGRGREVEKEREKKRELKRREEDGDEEDRRRKKWLVGTEGWLSENLSFSPPPPPPYLDGPDTKIVKSVHNSG